MRDSVGLHLDVFVIAFMGLVFLAVAFGFYHERLHLAPDGGFGPFIPMATFGLVGAGMTLKAVHLVMSWARYGRSRLKLETVPIPLGGAMKAELIMTRQFRAGRPLRVTLKCVNSVVHDYQSINKPFPTAEERSVELSRRLAGRGHAGLRRQRSVQDRFRGSRRPAGDHLPERPGLADLGAGRAGCQRPHPGLSRRVRIAGVRGIARRRRGGRRGGHRRGSRAQAGGLQAPGRASGSKSGRRPRAGPNSSFRR